MENKELIENLVAIKKAIINNAPDVLWMTGPTNETVCERIDLMLMALGVSDDVCLDHYHNLIEEKGV